MQISSTRNITPRQPLAAAKESQSTEASQETSAPPQETVDIGYDKEKAGIEQKALAGKAKVGGTIGAALGLAGGVAAGLVGGIAGTLVGLAVAPAAAVLGVVAGGVGGFMAVANREKTHVGHLIGGVLAGAVGAALLGTAGFYGGAALGAAAGAGGGALGAIAGAIGGTTIGGALGGLGVTGFELSANKEQYPNLLAELKKEAAEEAAREKKNEAETEKLKQERV
ncbi:MAG: hypothetical protein KC800_02110 [Candidatus Eremiobacteraeota bacterium]|nr:hypothetical protein [Candidatus Eremiobacteraeota bacterium]